MVHLDKKGREAEQLYYPKHGGSPVFNLDIS
jgi:hypothetical protein